MSIKTKLKVTHEGNNIYSGEDLAKEQTGTSGFRKWIARRTEKSIIFILLVLLDAAIFVAASKMIGEISILRNESLKTSGTTLLSQTENSSIEVSENIPERIIKIDTSETKSVKEDSNMKFLCQVLFVLSFLFPLSTIIGLTILLVRDESGIRYEKLDMLNDLSHKIIAEEFSERDYETSRQIKAIEKSIKSDLLKHYMNCITEI